MKTIKIDAHEIMKSNSMKLFTMLCGYFIFVLLLYTFCQFIDFSNCLGLVQILSILLPVIVYLLTLKNKKRIRTIIIVLSSYLFLTLLLPFIYEKTYDITVDGNSYHKTAIAFIKNNWNPLYESSRDFQKNNPNVYKFGKESKIDLWINHYPKATWITAATIYNMTGNIESGKCITFIFTIMLMIISYNCLNKILSKKWSLLISLLLIINPITLSQLFCYYVDSIMGILFTIELLLLLMIKPMEKQNPLIWLNLITICTFFVNIKYTGLMSSGIIAAVFYFYWLFKFHKEADFIHKFGKVTIYFVVTFVTAIFFVGANSYVKNTIDHLNPLYPIIGKDKVDIITTMQPASFKERGRLEKFFISNFSITKNITIDRGEPKLKLPFKVYKSEIGELLAPDTRIGGFGPLFGLILIVTTIIFIINLIIFLRKEKENIKFIVLPALSIILSMILMGESWWARYVPEFYLYVIGTIILTIYNSKYFQKEILAKILAFAIVSLTLLNASVFAYTNYYQLKTFSKINMDIKEMQNQKTLKIKLANEGLEGYGYFYTLANKNINFEIIREVKNPIRKYAERIEVEQ